MLNLVLKRGGGPWRNWRAVVPPLPRRVEREAPAPATWFRGPTGPASMDFAHPCAPPTNLGPQKLVRKVLDVDHSQLATSQLI